jgi:chromosome segregation ATPase
MSSYAEQLQILAKRVGASGDNATREKRMVGSILRGDLMAVCFLFQKQAEELRAQLGAKQGVSEEVAKMKREQEGLRAALRAAKEEKTKMAKMLRESLKQYEREHNFVKELQRERESNAELKMWRDDAQRLEREYAELSAAFEHVREEARDLEESLDDARYALTRLERQLETKNEELVALQGQVNLLTHDLGLARTETDIYRTAAQKAGQKCALMNAKKAETDQQIYFLSKQVDAASAVFEENAKLRAELVAAREALVRARAPWEFEADEYNV